MDRRRLTSCLSVLLCAVLQPSGRADGVAVLVKDIETAPARLPFRTAFAAPRADVVVGLGGVWRVEVDGSVQLLRMGRVLQQLDSGDLVGFSGVPATSPGQLWETDGVAVKVIAEGVAIDLDTLTGTHYVARLGSGLVINGYVGEPGNWGQAARWWLEGGEALELGPYGGTVAQYPGPGPHCTETISLRGGVVFCANDPPSPSGAVTGSLWFADDSLTSAPISSSRSNMRLSVRSGDFVFGRFDGGVVRSDGTVTGTQLFDGVTLEDSLPGAGEFETLGDGVVWFGPGGLWFLGPQGPPRVLAPLLPGYLLGSTSEHVFLRFGSRLETVATDGGRAELPVSRPTGARPMESWGSALVWAYPPGGVAAATSMDLHQSDGLAATLLVASSQDREGALTGATGGFGTVADGTVVALIDATGIPAPALVAPSSEPTPWKSLTLGGTASSSPSHLVASGEQLLFLAASNDAGTQLWSSRGTGTTTVPVTPESWAGCRTVAWRELLVRGDWVVGCVLPNGRLPIYRLTGDAALELVAAVEPGSGAFGPGRADAVELEDRLLALHGGVLHSIDANTSGSEAIAADFEYLIPAGRRALAVGRTSDQGWVVVGTDGTKQGTELIRSEPVESFTAFGGGAVVQTPTALFATEGTVGTTTDLGAPLGVLTMPPEADRVCGVDSEQRLWGVEATTGARQLLAQLDGPASWPLAAPDGDGRSTWFATTSPEGLSLWHCDGTLAGSRRVTSGLPIDLVAIAPTPGGVFVLSFDRNLQTLRRIARDGSSINIVVSAPLPLVDDRFSIPFPELVVAGRRVFFAHSDPDHGRELWSVRWDELFSDGFESGDSSAWSSSAP